MSKLWDIKLECEELDGSGTFNHSATNSSEGRLEQFAAVCLDANIDIAGLKNTIKEQASRIKELEEWLSVAEGDVFGFKSLYNIKKEECEILEPYKEKYEKLLSSIELIQKEKLLSKGT